LVQKQQYLQHSNIDRQEDPLVWWKQNCSHLPMLQELAKKYLCIPATSVPAERLFSKAGEVVSSRRSNLKPKKCRHVAVFKQEYRNIIISLLQGTDLSVLFFLVNFLFLFETI